MFGIAQLPFYNRKNPSRSQNIWSRKSKCNSQALSHHRRKLPWFLHPLFPALPPLVCSCHIVVVVRCILLVFVVPVLSIEVFDTELFWTCDGWPQNQWEIECYGLFQPQKTTISTNLKRAQEPRWLSAPETIGGSLTISAWRVEIPYSSLLVGFLTGPCSVLSHYSPDLSFVPFVLSFSPLPILHNYAPQTEIVVITLLSIISNLRASQ